MAVPMHLQFVKLGGDVCRLGLQLVRYTMEERLRDIIAAHVAAGCPGVHNHGWTPRA